MGLDTLYKARSLPEAITVMQEPEELEQACPTTISPEGLAALGTRFESLNESTARENLKKGRTCLGQALLKEYRAILSRQPITVPAQAAVAPQMPRLRPYLPTYYVPTQCSAEVKEILTTVQANGTPRHRFVVLHGPWGVGKTTLIIDLLHTGEPYETFRDGILSVSLSNKEAREKALWRACQQAGIDLQPNAETEELHQAFRDWIMGENRSALVILDDPQKLEDLEPFLAMEIGPKVVILVASDDHKTAEQAIAAQCSPTSDAVHLQTMSGLTAKEGQRLMDYWQSREELDQAEREARQHIGEMLDWAPFALQFAVTRALETNWHTVQRLIRDGNLNPQEFPELEALYKANQSLLNDAEKEALSSLQQTFGASTFGAGIAGGIWDKDPAHTQLQLKNLERQMLIEQVTQESWPLQSLIQAVYGGMERYQLRPQFRLVQLDDNPAEEDKTGESLDLEGFLLHRQIKSNVIKLVSLRGAERRSNPQT